MKVLITGGTGQVGHALISEAPAGTTVVAPGRDELDLSRLDDLADALRVIGPDAVINPAAYTAVDKAESEPELARRVNAEAPAEIARYCAAHAIPLLQVSTDFVFDGQASRPYRPEDPTAPLGVYGLTKLDGEHAVLGTCPSAWVMRASWVYSEHGNNFVKTMLRLAGEGKALNVVADQRGTPTYARNLAKALWKCLEVRPQERVLHFSDGGETTWYGFAKAIFAQAIELGLLDAPPELGPTTTAGYPTPARRPAYSVLDCSTTRALLKLQETGWEAALHDMLARLRRA